MRSSRLKRGVALALLLALLLAGCGGSPLVVPASTAEVPPAPAVPAEPPALAGRWSGNIRLPDGDLLVVAEFPAGPPGDAGIEGTMSIPAQGIPLLRLADVVYDPPNVSFDVALVGASFSGQLSDDTISGQFQQGEINTTFELHRMAGPAPTPANAK